jgi:hypothetical protein
MSPSPTAEHFRRHAELYGPELVVETAARDLDKRERAEFRGYVQHLERTKHWRAGRWHDRRLVSRPCEECGLDLPAGAKADMRRHVHCRERAAKRRVRARALGMGHRPQEGAGCAPVDRRDDVREAA